MSSSDQPVDTAAAALQLGVSRRQVQRLVKSRKLPAAPPRASALISPADLAAFLAARAAQTEPDDMRNT